MLARIEVIDKAAIDAVHDASLEILRQPGVHIPDPECISALADAGADVDRNSCTARITWAMVESALKQCARRYTLYGRNPAKFARFGFGDMVLLSSPGQFAWLDEDGRTRREPCSADMRDAALVGDALENVDIVGGLAMPLDIPAAHRDVFTAAELLRATSKPAQVWIAGGRTLEVILRMYEAVRGGSNEHRSQPMLHGFVEPVSPLRFTPNGLEVLKICARNGLPLCIGPMVQAGASGPATLAGTLAVENAEILAGIVLCQLFGPGTAVCYGGIPHIFDMRTTQISFGAPEQALMAVAMAQVARHYGLPCYVNVGLSDSKTMDAQSGLERGTTLLLGAMAGADTFGHMGIVGADQAGSLEQLIVDNEIAAFVKRLRRGIRVGPETLAVPVTREVGIGGTFLGEQHTRQHFRNELWFPVLFDRERWDAWQSSGARAVADRAREQKRQILARHQPEPLDEALDTEIQAIAASAKHIDD